MGGGWGLVLEPVGAQLFGLQALFVILIRTGAAGRSANPTLWGRCQIITGGHIDDPTTRSDIHSPITLAVALVWATRRNNA